MHDILFQHYVVQIAPPVRDVLYHFWQLPVDRSYPCLFYEQFQAFFHLQYRINYSDNGAVMHSLAYLLVNQVPGERPCPQPY